MSRQCRGYANSLPIVAPFISGLSTTSSILGATTIVTIFGENFRNYSTVYFGTTLINNVTYFSSGQLSFYVPAIATVGTYPIQVFNDTLASNIVFFTIDNSVGFWNQDPATGAITNNNASGGININGQLTVNKPITLNYQPSLITNNTQLGYTIGIILQPLSGLTSSSVTIVPLTIIPSGVWLVTGTTGSSTASWGSDNISSLSIELFKDGLGIPNVFFQSIHTNCGITESISFSTIFVSTGTNTFGVILTTQLTTVGQKYSNFSNGPTSQITFIRIA